MLIVVLNDGETWTNVAGCLVLEVDEDIEDHEVKRLASHRGAALVAELAEPEQGRLAVLFGPDPQDDGGGPGR
jgi:hypothetical protein